MSTNSDNRTRTAWHPLAVQAIRGFVPEEYDVLEEFSLSVLPERVDIVIVECSNEHHHKAEALGAIMDRLNQHNLIEVKGATDRLEGQDFLVLMGYATRYMVNRRLTGPEKVNLFTLSDGIPDSFRNQVEKFGFAMTKTSPGIEEVGPLPGGMKLYCIDADLVSKTPGNGLFYLFTRKFLKTPRKMLPALSPSEAWMYSQLASHVVQLEKDRREDNFTYRGFDMLKRSMEEAAEAMLDILPVESRLRGLRPEERLRGLRPEDRLRGLPPEERLRGLRPEDLVQSLNPEDRDKLRKLLL